MRASLLTYFSYTKKTKPKLQANDKQLGFFLFFLLFLGIFLIEKI